MYSQYTQVQNKKLQLDIVCNCMQCLFQLTVENDGQNTLIPTTHKQQESAI